MGMRLLVATCLVLALCSAACSDPECRDGEEKVGSTCRPLPPKKQLDGAAESVQETDGGRASKDDARALGSSSSDAARDEMGDVPISDADAAGPNKSDANAAEVVSDAAAPEDSAQPVTDSGSLPPAGEPKLDQGASCKDSSQCATGHCTDGVCCDSADCAGSCQACNVPGARLGTCSHYDNGDVSTTNDAPTGACAGSCMACDGTSDDCVNVPLGADWKNACSTTPAASCGTTGVCDGMGKCQLQGPQTSCDDGLYCNGADSCDGAGTCKHAGDPCSSVACGVCDETSNSCPNNETWYDAANNLTWEVTLSTGALNWSDAINHCNSLTRCGQSDWRVPDISELRQLTRGCAGTSNFISGCIVTPSGNFTSFSKSVDCTGCAKGAGPSAGCYRPAEVGGPCSNLWSSTDAVNTSDTAIPESAWFISFQSGAVNWLFKEDIFYDVRCVRTGP